MKTKLEELKNTRLKWVDINRENGFDEGIKHLLTDLYPDNAHFIYELLQNAEDPEATEVVFTLTDSDIEFEHNGKRLFTLKDVESITSIGTSTKRDDDTSIGKFGVGFKAVFAYTNSPEIYSGDFNFRIHDLVVPSQEGVVRPKMDANKTRFVFPFDNARKVPEKAVKEIERSLLGLGDNTLLFLNHIKKIEYMCPNGGFGSLERIDLGKGHIEIQRNNIDGSHEFSRWLHFQKEVEVREENGENHLCTIAIAFKLTEISDKKSPAPKWKLIPVEPGEVSIFFPAEKETSNLKFHIHAPFASTVARDSVRDCDGNYQLRDHIAELLVEALESIRDQGLLAVNFLSVLPNPTDNLPEFYEPIREKLVHAFQTQNLTPTNTKQGLKYSPAQKLYRGPAAILKTLSDSDMIFFLGKEVHPPIWVANAPQEHQRDDRFIKSLGIQLWGWSELAEAVCDFNDLEGSEKSVVEDWLYKQSDSWVQRFYTLLGDACSLQRMNINVDDLKIIRIETGSGDSMVKPHKAFLPPIDNDANLPKGVDFVKQAVFNPGKLKQQKLNARSFLEYVGVAVFDEHQEIKLLIEKYSEERGRLGQKKHLEDMTRIVSYCSNYPHKIQICKNKFLLMSENKELGQKFFLPSDCYFDAPFGTTGLGALFNSKNIKLEKYKHPILNEYIEIEGFSSFASAIGVMTKLEVLKSNATNLQSNIFHVNSIETHTTIDRDYYISGLNIAIGTYYHRDSSVYSLGELNIATEQIHLSLVLWQTMCQVDEKHLIAFYHPNDSNSHLDKRASSFLVTQLRSCKWIPDKNSLFHSPQDITVEDLHLKFQYDNRNGWLSAIGFGEGEVIRSKEYKDRTQKAQDLGFDSIEEIEKFRKIKDLGISVDDILASAQPVIQPEAAVPNPERRRKGVLERKENAHLKQSIIRERKIQPGLNDSITEAKAYLRAKYTNESKETICQCCQNIMPFKIGTDYYFEAVQCIKKVDKLYFQNRLALCPNCSAKYQYIRETKDEQLRDLIINAEGEDESFVEIPITLGGQSYSLRFVATHWFDLKNILES